MVRHGGGWLSVQVFKPGLLALGIIMLSPNSAKPVEFETGVYFKCNNAVLPITVVVDHQVMSIKSWKLLGKAPTGKWLLPFTSALLVKWRSKKYFRLTIP
jgi:hypothetical protein